MDNLALVHKTKLSPAIEDYVEAIYMLHQEHPQVTTSVLAAQLGFAPAPVTGMIQRLAKLNLVIYTPYHGVVLTNFGQCTAREVLRRYHLPQRFLVEVLDYSWHEAQAEAEVLEHVISEMLAARIAQRLGHPIADPHGGPIPFPDSTLPPDAYELLVGHAAYNWESPAEPVCLGAVIRQPFHLQLFAA